MNNFFIKQDILYTPDLYTIVATLKLLFNNNYISPLTGSCVINENTISKIYIHFVLPETFISHSKVNYDNDSLLIFII